MNTIMASFEAKIGWKRSRKRENKNYRSVPFRSKSMHNRKFQKKTKKLKKLKNTIMASFQAQTGWKRLRERIKIIVSFRSVPTRRVRENS